MKDRTGEKYGQLTAVRPSRRAYGRIMWVYRCACGGEREMDICHAIDTGHCGCLTSRNNQTHGMTLTKTYKSWRSAVIRCTLKSSKTYTQYGGRGIKICDRWRFGEGGKSGFECFYADMGERPLGKTLDRIDNSGGYAPTNCRWATLKEQCRNTRSNRIVSGKCLSEWAELSGFSFACLWYRLKGGWTLERAITQPLRKQKKRVVCANTGTQ